VAIDLLCGYLREPPDGVAPTENEPNPPIPDAATRNTIIQVIARHLRAVRERPSWSDRDYDFRTARLDQVDFCDATFATTTFGAATWFSDARFKGDAGFARAEFSGPTATGRVAPEDRTTDFTGAVFARRIPPEVEPYRFSDEP
jgi:hypothetical protein